MTIACNSQIILLGYADDLVFLADSAVDLRKLLKALHEYCNINCLILNPRKSKIVIFIKGGLNESSTFLYGDTKIEVVNDYLYLGTIFSNKGLFVKSTKNTMAKSNLASSSTLSIISSAKFMISWTKLNLLFDSLVASIIAHGSPIWSLNHLNMLEKIQCQFFKKLLFLPRNTPNYAVRLETGRPHLAVTIFKLALGWLNKLLNMDSSRYPYKCFVKLCNLESNKSNLTKYNWVAIIKNVFFQPINELKIWDNVHDFLDQNKITALLEKYRNYMYSLDYESVSLSSSLRIYPIIINSVNKYPQEYLTFNMNFDLKRVFAQFRLLNKFNMRIIYKNRLLLIEKSVDCNYCNIGDVDFLHWITVCERFRCKRISYFSDIKSNLDFTAYIYDGIEVANIDFVKNFINFLMSVLDSCVYEGSVKVIT